MTIEEQRKRFNGQLRVIVFVGDYVIAESINGESEYGKEVDEALGKLWLLINKKQDENQN